MPNYPGGKKTPTIISDKKITKSKSCNSANRGMAFEADINVSNAYYLDQNRAIITKRPTPINVVKPRSSRTRPLSARPTILQQWMVIQ